MKIPAGWTQTYEFACHSKACAPPPAGTGGSKGSGSGVATLVAGLTSTGFVPRKEMPQFTGVPRPGSKASLLPRTDHGTVHAFNAFASHLRAKGVKVSDSTVPAKSLKASQSELDVAKVREMADRPDFSATKVPVLTSSDGYVIDGHHRWAAQMLKDQTGPVKVRTVDVTARELIPMSREWTLRYGLEAKR